MKKTTAALSDACSYCGGYHNAMCPRIAEIEYHADGTVKRVKLHPTISQTPASVIKTSSPFGGSLTITSPPMTTWTVNR